MKLLPSSNSVGFAKVSNTLVEEYDQGYYLIRYAAFCKRATATLSLFTSNTQTSKLGRVILFKIVTS